MTTAQSTRELQSITAELATRTGTHWTQSEIDTVRNTTRPLAEVAVDLGRSLYSVTYARTLSVERSLRGSGIIERSMPFDRGFTDIEALFAD